MNEEFKVIIIGAGPAGLTAGIYLARAKVKVLIIDSGMPGGQVNLTHEIANYPGIETISGYMLAANMKKQAESFGCKILSNKKITKISLSDTEKIIETDDNEIYNPKAVIIATGGKSRKLNIPGETEYTGKGISYCATCDGDFFQDKELIVVGGGNTALEEAVALTKYASKITIIHQFDNFQAHEHAIQEAKSNEKISFILETKVTNFKGGEIIETATLENIKTGKETEININGAFIFIGYTPETDFVKDILTTSPAGEIITNSELVSNVAGVFAAGDVRKKKIRQITTAVSDGTITAMNAVEYL